MTQKCAVFNCSTPDRKRLKGKTVQKEWITHPATHTIFVNSTEGSFVCNADARRARRLIEEWTNDKENKAPAANIPYQVQEQVRT